MVKMTLQDAKKHLFKCSCNGLSGISRFKETETTKLALRVQWKTWFINLNLRSHSAHTE